MNVQIQSVKFDADRKLVEFVEHKMDKLDRFVERAIGADVILKLDKDHELGNKVATINLHIPGDDLVAESRGKAVLLVASSDLSHYHPKAQARAMDERVRAAIQAMAPKGVKEVIVGFKRDDVFVLVAQLRQRFAERGQIGLLEKSPGDIKQPLLAEIAHGCV